MAKTRFDWDQDKDDKNQKKHGVSFALAQLAFADSRRVIAEDLSHGYSEQRYFCFGQVGAGDLTVRFTYRENVIRIHGTSYWHKGQRLYERQKQIHGTTHPEPEGT